MATATTESSPLIPAATKPSLQSQSRPPVKPQRTVTFNPTVSSSSAAPTPPPPRAVTQIPSALGNQTTQVGQSTATAPKQGTSRRSSHGAPLAAPTLPTSKIGPQRTTKTAQKLKILPDPEHGDEGPDEESGRDVYAQFTRIKDPTARRDAARLGKEDREVLPRVTAYCTAGSYRMDSLMRYLKGKVRFRGAAPKLFDECIYTPYRYGKSDQEKARKAAISNARVEQSNHVDAHRRYSDSAIEEERRSEQRIDDLIDLQNGADDVLVDTENGSLEAVNLPLTEDLPMLYTRPPDTPDFDTEVHTPEIFLFGYGTVVIWGMTVEQEQRFLKEIAKFEIEKLGVENIQIEDFNFYYTREYQARIYNDFISLRDKKNYMTKLAISHALSQSVKTSLYEDLVDNTIETTKEIPSQIANTGKVNLTRREINMQIGELFILRINIHLQGSVLDAPELMWAEPQLDPIYQAVRSYLEMDQRVGLLTERLNVIADLLAVLKDQLTHTHGEYLEWIVIVLIAAEIVVAAVNILVDLYAGVD